MYPIKNNNFAEIEQKSSALHKRAVLVVKSRFPTVRILEEISVKVDVGKTLFLDIYLPSLGIIIEVNGKQHFERCAHFQSKEQFSVQRHNDRIKSEWAELNELRLVNFNYDESDTDWKHKLDG